MLKRLISSVLAIAAVFSAVPACPVTAADDDTDPEYERILGDVDGDGMITAADAAVILKDQANRAVEKPSLFDDPEYGQLYSREIADVDRDGHINAIDAGCILTFYAYMATGFDVTFPELLADRAAYPQTYTADGGFTEEQIAESPIKPVITVSKILADQSQISNTFTISVDIDSGNADLGYYSTLGLHVYYDPRLTVERNRAGEISIQQGSGTYFIGMVAKSEAEPGAEMNSFYVAMASDDNSGFDGTLFTFNVTLPESAKPGDAFPIDIRYESGDLFIDNAVTEKGSLMQAYLFTQGINTEGGNGLTFSVTELYKYPGLAEIDRSCDGYIAIEAPPGDEIIWGDANVDGKVDLQDAVAILQYVALPKKYPLTEKGLAQSDVSGSDGISGRDALSIQMYDAHLISELPEK
ncbi:MAG: hypothetical protein IJ071_03065 [Ruminococcus sp.]|nr:hypothetical protein [Ruminococcus sp.]